MRRSIVTAALASMPSVAVAQQPAPPDSARRLPTVVVTAARDTTLAARSPLPTAVLGETELRREHGVALAPILARVAGVQALRTGEQVGKPVIRGLGGARVLVLDDGLRLEDYSWSDEDGPSVDARLAERVELVRGPASVLYGSDALGGVVNVRSAPLPDARAGRPARRPELELYGASNNREGGAALSAEGERGRVGARGRLVARLGQDVRTPAGTIRNTGFGAFNGEGALGVHHDGGAETTLRVAHYGGEFKLLETDTPAGGVPEDEGGPERVTLDDRVQLAHVRRAGALRLEARGQWQRHALAEKADVPDPAPGEPKDATIFDLVLNTVSADVLVHHAAGALAGTVGVSGLAQRNETRGIVPLVPGATIRSGGVFAFERLTLGRLGLLAGVRGDARHLQASADDRFPDAVDSRDAHAVTADAGATFDLTPAFSVAANVGRAWRAPTLFELYANGPRLGEGRYEIGRYTLRPEVALDADASLRWSSPGRRAELAAFRNRVSDFIYIAPTAFTRDGLRVYQYDQADAVLSGGELSAAVDVPPRLTLRGRADVVRGTNERSADPLPLVPPARVALGLDARPGSAARAAYASADVEYVARSSRLSAEEREPAAAGRFPLATPSHVRVDLGAGVATSLFGRPTRVDVRVRNAADARYRDFLNRYKEFAYDAGRDVALRLTTTL